MMMMMTMTMTMMMMMMTIVIGISVPLTHNLPKTSREIAKYEKLAWKSKIFGRLTTCLYTP
jgi:hypothetical protein